MAIRLPTFFQSTAGHGRGVDIRQRVNEVEDRHVVGEVPTPHAPVGSPSRPRQTPCATRRRSLAGTPRSPEVCRTSPPRDARRRRCGPTVAGRPGRSSMRGSSASSSAEASGPENPLISRTIRRIRSGSTNDAGNCGQGSSAETSLVMLHKQPTFISRQNVSSSFRCGSARSKNCSRPPSICTHATAGVG